MKNRSMVSRLCLFTAMMGISLANFPCVSQPAMAVEASGELAADQVVEWFAAEEAGQIEVKFIPVNATEANIIVKNISAKPLQIRLPEAFAAVPILAQGGFGGGGGGFGGGGQGGGGQGGGGQGMGGGGGGGGLGGGGQGGGGGGMFRVDSDTTRKMKVVTVCLEHGKPDPNPRIPYKMIPAEKFTSDPRVLNICKMLGYGMVAQNTAQAAAWHLTDNLSWQQLAEKNRMESKYTGNVPFFSPFELRQASAVVAEATQLAEKASPNQKKPYYEQPGYEGN